MSKPGNDVDWVTEGEGDFGEDGQAGGGIDGHNQEGVDIDDRGVLISADNDLGVPEVTAPTKMRGARA